MNSLWRTLVRFRRRVAEHPGSARGISLAASLTFTPAVKALDLSGVKQIEMPSQRDLSHERLLQQAASVSVNAATQLLTQTAVAIVDISDQYKKALMELMSVLEESQNGIIDVTYEKNDVVIALRAKSNDLKHQLLELDTLLDYVERVVISTAETSYLIGAEFVSTTLTERLYNLKSQLEEKRKEIAVLETECLQLQKNIITATK